MDSSKIKQTASPKLRIAVEARRIFSRHKCGMDVMALEMIRHLQLADTYNEYFILAQRGDDVCLFETPNFHIVYLDGFGYPVWEQLVLPRWVQRNRPDILHCTSSTAPLRVSCPLVLTLHDLTFLEDTGGVLCRRLCNAYRRWVTPRASRAARLVLTVSSYQKEHIKARLQLPDEKVKVVYNGVSPQFLDQATPQQKREARHAYELPDRYILLMANGEPRKNLQGVLSAYALLLEGADGDVPALVVCGVTDRHLSKVLSRMRLQVLAQHVRAIGYVRSNLLPAVYQQAEMLLLPSYSEGFGLPIIEAMASGIPVVTSDVTAMPEVAGDAALLVSPSSAPNIAKAMELLLTTTMLRNIIVQKAQERLPHFGWPDKAAEVLGYYIDLASAHAAEPRPDGVKLSR
jgi:glycosyltransferase involved in cell wall biosynthesis